MIEERQTWDVAKATPAVRISVKGVERVADLLALLLSPSATDAQRELGDELVRGANHELGGRAALALLRDRGGPDLLVEVVEYGVEAPMFLTVPHVSAGSVLFTLDRLGGVPVRRRNCGPWERVSRAEVEAAAGGDRVS